MKTDLYTNMKMMTKVFSFTLWFSNASFVCNNNIQVMALSKVASPI